MKNLLYILVVFNLISCGGGGGDDTPPPPPVQENRTPTAPNLTAPADELLCVDNTVTFEWSASTDADGDAITYEIQIATDNGFNTIVESKSISSTSISVSLQDDTAYYWRVKAKDTENASSGYSTTFKFYTYGIGVENHLPYAPGLEAPLLNAVVNPDSGKVLLKWNASDVDTNDTLTYDVYFGTDNPPTGDPATTSNKELEVDIEASKSYFWKVVVKDNNGGITIGQVWAFKTD